MTIKNKNLHSYKINAKIDKEINEKIIKEIAYKLKNFDLFFFYKKFNYINDIKN